MIIYIDILVCLNIIIDYFLISLTSFILKSTCSFARQLLGAVVGGICSIAILIPINNYFFDFALRLLTSSFIILASFGFSKLRLYIRRIISFFIASFVFSGCMIAIIDIFEISNLKVKNGIVYYDLSAIILVIITAITYFLLTFIMKFVNRKKVQTCKLRISDNNVSAEIIALVDSGNKLKEPFSEKWVLILDPKYLNDFKGENKPHRVIPYNTIGNNGLITGFCPDKILLISNGDEEKLDMYLAFSPNPLKDEYGAIIPADAI